MVDRLEYRETQRTRTTVSYTVTTKHFGTFPYPVQVKIGDLTLDEGDEVHVGVLQALVYELKKGEQENGKV